jgi:hypothetical protein
MGGNKSNNLFKARASKASYHSIKLERENSSENNSRRKHKLRDNSNKMSLIYYLTTHQIIDRFGDIIKSNGHKIAKAELGLASSTYYSLIREYCLLLKATPNGLITFPLHKRSTGRPTIKFEGKLKDNFDSINHSHNGHTT